MYCTEIKYNSEHKITRQREMLHFATLHEHLQSYDAYITLAITI